jgi:RNA polymerase sigma factor (sigma-70 family)
MADAGNGILFRDNPNHAGVEAGRDPSDRQLLERYVARRDETAFAGLVERYGRAVWGVCRRVLPQAADAEDAFQAVFLVLARKAGSIHRREAVGSWLYGVAYRTAMRARRTAARRHETEEKAERVNAQEPPWGQAACRELQRILDEEMQRLPEKYRAPFFLCCLEGMSKAEAAQELGWKDGTVSSRLATARRLLQNRLARRGVTLSAALAVGALAQGTAAAAAPALLVEGTTKAVLAGKAAGLAPATVTLANGLIHTMAIAKVKAALAWALALLTLITGAGVAATYLAPGGGPVANAVVAADEPVTYQVRPQPLLKPIDEQIMAIALSPDGKRLVTAGTSQEGKDKSSRLKFWDVATAKEVGFLDRVGGTRTMAFSPDGQTLACGEYGGAIRLRDPATGEEQATLRGHDVGVNSLAFSGDGNFLLSAGLDKKVTLWDWRARKPLKTFEGHDEMIFSVAFFRHGRGFVTTARDKTARIWDINTGLEKSLRGHRSGVEAVAVSPDDKVVATASWDGSVKLWDAETGEETAALNANKGAVLAVAFSPDGKLLAASAGNGRLCLWDAKTHHLQGTLQRHYGLTYALAFTPDSKTLISGSADTTVKIWDLAAGKESSVLWAGDYKPIVALAQSPDGKLLAVAHRDKSVHLRDAESGVLLRAVEGHETQVTCLAFSADGKVLAAGSGDAIKLWDPATGNEEGALAGHTGGVTALAFTRRKDGLLASAGADNVVRFWDVNSRRERAALRGHEQTVHALAFAPDGRYLASGGADRTIRIWDVTEQTEVNVLRGHEGAVRALAYFPSGKLASGGDDAVVRLWQPGEGLELHALAGHNQAVVALAISPGGGTLASAGSHTGVVVWDSTGGQIRQVLEGHRSPVTALVFAPQNGHLVSAGQDARLLRWLPEPPKALVEGPAGNEPFIHGKLRPEIVAELSRLRKLQPVAPPDPAPEPAPTKSHWKAWLALVMALFLGMTLALTYWFNRRTRSPISFPCPACGNKLKVSAALAGKKGKCPQCGQSVQVPTPSSSTSRTFSMRALVGTGLTVAAIVVCCVLAVLENTDGAKVEEKRLEKPVEIVMDLETTLFDAPQSAPDIGDKQLGRLQGMPNLRHLILNNAPITDAGLKDINSLVSLQSLSLTGTEITDAGLASLKDLNGLVELRLDRLRITDAGLEHLKAFPNLRKLTLWRAAVTDAGVAHLKPLTGLVHLSLDETQVSDEGLQELYGLAGLRYLSLWRTKVTDQGVAELSQKMPQVKVNR